MKIKFIYSFLICISAIILYCIFLYWFGAWQMGTVFQESLYAIFATGVSLSLVAFFGMSLWSLFEKLIIILLALSVTFNFAIFGPIFIDRSISYHLVMLTAENKRLPVKKINDVVFEQMLKKRIEELSQAGLIEVDQQKNILPTDRGKGMTKFLVWLGLVTGTLNEYSVTNDAINQ